jgi:cation:H+ antiporter
MIDFTLISMFVAGFWFLTKGADMIVRHATRVAREMGISKFMIGLTLVAFSTTLPEMTVSIMSAVSGAATIATGTIVGSMIVNIGLILGLAAIIRPLTTDDEAVKLNYFMIIFVLMFSVVLFDGILWYEGLILITAFMVYLYSYFLEVRRHTRLQTLVGTKKIVPNVVDRKEKTMNIMFSLLGGVIVVMGAQMLVSSTMSIAEMLHVSELVISVLAISVGTSLPELAVAITGALRHVRGISIGNIVGANIYNVFTLGLVSLISTVPVTSRFLVFNIPLMIILSFMLLLFMKTQWKVTKIEGVALFSVYLIFVALQFFL